MKTGENRMKKTISMTLSVLVLTIVLGTTVFANTGKAIVFVNGKPQQEQGIIKNNRVFVPVRVITEELGFKVNYNSVGKEISLKKLSNEIVLYVDKKTAHVNGVQGKIQVAPFVQGGATYVPLRLISEILGEKVEWDAKNKIVLAGEILTYRAQSGMDTYVNEQGGYSLELLAHWDNRVIVENKNGTINVYDKATVNRLAKDGVKAVKPVFEIRIVGRPTIARSPEEENVLLAYDKGRYIEAIFYKDMQYHKDTVESFLKTREQGMKMVQSLKILN